MGNNMSKITHRPRRLRRSESIRSSVAETRLSPSQLVYPLFVMERGTTEPIPSMPGVSRYSLDTVREVLAEAVRLGIGGVALFPKIEDAKKNSDATECLNEQGLIPAVVRIIKAEFSPLTVFTDIALDPFSSDGHDGLVRNGVIVNDPSVALLAQMAVVHARAGADFVAPSDMMDGRVAAIRHALDEAGFHDVGIMSYCAKYASCFYGPFRDALDSAPRGGDKKTYQMDPRNSREALRELRLDTAEGADVVMVKPAGAYLDVIQTFRRESDLPVAAYQVSGEYSMLCVGAKAGLFDLGRATEESLIAIRRAGADLIFTYFALDMARRLQ
jgi:porphobilinogen synthase